MPPRLALSTSVCSVPDPPQALLERWLALRAGHPLALALDARLPLAVQGELLARLRPQALTCAELAHPLGDAHGRRAASPISQDRAERRAATQALLETLRLAVEHEVPRVVLQPWELTLRLELERLRERLARGRHLALDELAAQRSAAAPAALDRLLSSLDPLLDRAAREGVTVALLTPTIWPHQVPNDDELTLLRAELAGAPLDGLPARDWQYAAGVVGSVAADRGADPSSSAAARHSGDAWAQALSRAATPAGPGSTLFVPTFTGAEPPAANPSLLTATEGLPPVAPPAPSLPRARRLADAAGLRLRLPLGCGEIDWARETRPLCDADGEAVLAFDRATTSGELARSLALLDASTADGLPSTR